VNTIENDDQQTTIEFQHLVKTKRSIYQITSPAVKPEEYTATRQIEIGSDRDSMPRH
jgi:hypothetical protein